ncbi:TPA: hypothetical protein PWY45_001944 [Mannheimia haemolytica]|nr:hypothetical protein [Mannheimia haemolytica]EEY13227.1 hypothetical protein COK_0660 [Mannheimia haemolytica serotype A2 str. BOVINE]MDW0535887.1 hypothetical protein [Mannheimia haemolytica]MDW0538488.1 hypothetical protein [Mannheimia haemolytica]MDW0546335.1 hypothetical protein [Mannheimia haemolytica]MDW0572812.1 hypothetical protein [Mannheimia haemolytica]
MNVSSVVGVVVSSKLATLHELQTIYGLEDALDLIEVFSVDTYNHRDNK